MTNRLFAISIGVENSRLMVCWTTSHCWPFIKQVSSACFITGCCWARHRGLMPSWPLRTTSPDGSKLSDANWGHFTTVLWSCFINTWLFTCSSRSLANDWGVPKWFLQKSRQANYRVGWWLASVPIWMARVGPNSFRWASYLPLQNVKNVSAVSF